MTNDARKAIHQMLRILGDPKRKSYIERTDMIHGCLKMANHLLPCDDYPDKEFNEIFDTVLGLRSEEYVHD